MGAEQHRIVQAHGLTKVFDERTVVDNIDLEVDSGVIVGLIGPSGSGKTTTTRLLLGIVKPTAGTVEVFGRPPDTFTADERVRVGYMPQLLALYPNLSIQQNLRFAASIYGVSPLRRQRLREALTFVELTEHRRKRLRDASGGMQRRVALAATLLHDPDLLFLDEPTAGVDPVLRLKFWQHFADLRDQGRTLFVTTQYVSEAAHCDRVALLVQGRLLAYTTPEGLRRSAFGGDYLDVVTETDVGADLLRSVRAVPEVVSVESTRSDGRGFRALVEDGDRDAAPLRAAVERSGVPVSSISRHLPTFDEAFVKLVADHSAADVPA